MCKGRSKPLEEFIIECFSCRFKQAPNYGKLSKMLVDLIREETSILKAKSHQVQLSSATKATTHQVVLDESSSSSTFGDVDVNAPNADHMVS